MAVDIFRSQTARTVSYLRRVRGVIAICLSVAIVGCSSQSSIAQDDPEDRTIQTMGRVGLTDSAVAYATARRALVAEDPSQAAKWTMRLMESYAFSALHSRNGAEQHWEKCSQELQKFTASDPKNSRIPWLVWQLARCDLWHAQSDVASYLAAPANAEPRDQALERVRKILNDSEKLTEDIDVRQPLAAREGLANAQQAPAEQLAKLSVDVGLLRCEALLLRARLYQPGTADRIASATDVDRQAAAILRRTEPDWPSRSQLQVAQATARLDLGQTAEALQTLEVIALGTGNRLAETRAATVAIEYLAASSSQGAGVASATLSRAHNLLMRLQQLEAGPEFDLAAIQLALAEVQRKSGEAKQSALAQLIARSRELGERYGDYWRSRAESLMVGSLGGEPSVGDSSVAHDLVLVEVRQLLAAGENIKAIDKLLAFRDNQIAAGRGGVALKVAAQAAALLQREQAWSAAADAVATVSRQFASSPGAAEAHQQAIFCLSQALKQSSENQALKSRYESLLKDQLLVWPDSAASDEAQQWLTYWFSATGRRNELPETLLQRAAVAEKPQVVQQSLMEWLGETLNLGSPALVQQQLDSLAAIKNKLHFENSSASIELLMLVADVGTNWQSPAEQDQSIRRITMLEGSLTTMAQQQLCLAVRWLAAIRSNDRLENLPPTLRQWEPSELLPRIREGLAVPLIAAIDETPVTAHAEWAKLTKLNAAWQELLLSSPEPRSQAAGYRLMAWTDNASRGLEGLRALVQQAERGGGSLQLELSNALADSGPNRLEDSSLLAKVLIANSPAGSDLDLAARWRLCKNQIMLGKVDEAKQGARLLLATQPLATKIWQARFESLARP